MSEALKARERSSADTGIEILEKDSLVASYLGLGYRSTR